MSGHIGGARIPRNCLSEVERACCLGAWYGLRIIGILVIILIVVLILRVVSGLPMGLAVAGRLGWPVAASG